MPSIRTRLVAIAVGTALASLAAVEVYESASESELAAEQRDAVELLARAIAVRFEPRRADDARLRGDDVHPIRVTPTGPGPLSLGGPDGLALLVPHGVDRTPDTPPEAMDLLVPVSLGAQPLGYVAIAMTPLDIGDRMSRLRVLRWGVAGVIALVTLLGAALLARQLTRPLDTLRTAATQASSGHYDAALPLDQDEEIRPLVAAFAELQTALTERELLRKRLAVQEREALVGQVTTRMAHDLRNPLNFLSLAVEQLMSVEPTPLLVRLGPTMKAEIQRANDRIAELLRGARTAELRRREVDVAELLAALVPSMSLPHEAGVELRVEGPILAELDREVVEGVLRNLITNAIEASPGAPQLTLRAEAIEPDAVAIHVEDRGSGLPVGDLEQIFDPYYTTKSQGVGLGLSVARRSARQHGGDLIATPRPGGGARFSLILPRHAPGGAP